MEAKAKIKDYMISISEYPALNLENTLREAVNKIYHMSKEKGYRWIVVLDDNGNLAGFLTLRSIFEAIKKLTPVAGEWMGIYTKTQLIRDTPLKKCIRPLVNVFVYETDDVIKAADIILNERITILPVLNRDSEVVGILRPIDILPFIKELFEDEISPEEID